MIKVFLTIGMISIGLSGIYMGAWTTAGQQRADFHTQSAEQRKRRTNIGLIFGGVALISLLLAGLMAFLSN